MKLELFTENQKKDMKFIQYIHDKLNSINWDSSLTIFNILDALIKVEKDFMVSIGFKVYTEEIDRINCIKRKRKFNKIKTKSKKISNNEQI